MADENKTLRPQDALHLIRIALADVVASLGEMPKYADRYANLGALLDLLSKVTAQGGERLSVYHHLESSQLFCNTVSSYICSQSAAYCLGCVDHPDPEKQKTFKEQKKKLFEEAQKGLRVRAAEVYSLAYSCPKLITVDEVTFYYGGAGRLCSDSHMTKIVTSMKEAEHFAFQYLVEHTPQIDYIEIFKELENGEHTRKLFTDGAGALHEIFKTPGQWIGSRRFFEWLKNAGVTLEEFWGDFSDTFSNNEWLRPFLRIACCGEELGDCYNQLQFDPEHGCRWDIRPYSFYERLSRPPTKG